jgi:SAM-dependent methyltransferase
VADSNFQELGHGEGHDYGPGSPHLKHPGLSSMIIASLTKVTLGLGNNPPEILEVGAGHGTFTAVLRSLGARVTVTEMSKASAEHLSKAFSGDTSVEVIYDPEGSWAQVSDRTFDAVFCISVLHHIPDYLAASEQYCQMIRPGGAFISWQDPILYSHVSRRDRRAAVVSYYLWRITQGDWQRGLQTASRRLRGVLDETNVADMVEYHVVRDGVDEEALAALLSGYFPHVSIARYWSTQASALQAWGERRGTLSTFGIVADRPIA